MSPAFEQKCVRRIANFTTVKNHFKLDNSQFEKSKNELKRSLPVYSPKLQKLMEMIKKLDDHDMKKTGKHFKHFIFSDVPFQGAGAKITASVFEAYGYNLVYDRHHTMARKETLMKTKGANFALLCQTPVFGKPLPISKENKGKLAIINQFNERPENVYGDLCRFIILDRGFKEGIDLFDVKYVHILEPQTSKADLRQAIGRATRHCGQKGLEFDPKRGWPLQVFVYDTELPRRLQESLGCKTLFELYQKSTDTDTREAVFADELEQACIQGSIDYMFNKPIHGFKVEDNSDNAGIHGSLFTGGATAAMDCKSGCKSKKSQSFPISTGLMFAAFLATGGVPPDMRSSNAREYLCEQVAANDRFCAMVKRAQLDEKAFIGNNSAALVAAYKSNEHAKLNAYTKRQFLEIVNEAILYQQEKQKQKKKPSKKKGQSWVPTLSSIPQNVQGQASQDQASPQPQLQTTGKWRPSLSPIPQNDREGQVLQPTNGKWRPSLSSIPQNVDQTPLRQSSQAAQTAQAVPQDDFIPFANKDVKDGFKSMPPLKNNPTFKDVRAYVDKHMTMFAWPPMTLRNECVSQGGGASTTKLSSFMPSQNFVRHFFTPAQPMKGMLYWHSVGTGKTCAAIATASTTFAREGYTILWATRRTLKGDLWKDMFLNVCDDELREKIEAGEIHNIPLANKDALKKDTVKKNCLKQLSPAWSIRPISYKQLENAITNNNDIGQQLRRKNSDDPLRKVLIIVDEAHKLFGGEDLSRLERPNVDKIIDGIQNSYIMSGKDSVRVLLLTGTPISSNPMQMIRLLNMLKEDADQMPEEFDHFQKSYLDKTGRFTPKGKFRFLNNIAGHISYLNRERDARQFAQVNMVPVFVPLSGANDVNADRHGPEEEAMRKDIDKKSADLQDAEIKHTHDVQEMRKEKQNKCAELPKTERADCRKRYDVAVKASQEKYRKDRAAARAKLQTMKNKIKSLESEKEDDKFTQEHFLFSKCVSKPKKPKSKS